MSAKVAGTLDAASTQGTTNEQNDVGTPSTSSYATVVLKDNKDNNKENINKTGKNEHLDQPQTTTHQIKDQSQSSSTVLGTNRTAEQSDENVSNGPMDVEDDSTFTPVVSHHRKDRKSRRKDQIRDNGNGKNGNGGNGNGRNGNKSGDKKESKRSKERQREKDNTKPADTQQTADQQNTSKASTSSGDEKSDAAPKKFVEAPLPKVNAWKVNIYLNYFCYILLL